MSEPRWSVFVGNDGRVSIWDDDFGWDAGLRLYGDFGTAEEKFALASAIVKILNCHPRSIPTRDSYQANPQGKSE
jgi:hypothetical protein